MSRAAPAWRRARAAATAFVAVSDPSVPTTIELIHGRDHTHARVILSRPRVTIPATWMARWSIMICVIAERGIAIVKLYL